MMMSPFNFFDSKRKLNKVKKIIVMKIIGIIRKGASGKKLDKLSVFGICIRYQ